jgi:hypothetical protein
MRVTILILLLSSAALVHAQSNYPAPPHEVEEFAFLIGDWDVTGQVLAADGTWKDFAGTATYEWQLAGHGLHEHFSGAVEGQAVEGISFRVVDSQRRIWATVWADTYLLDTIARTDGEFQGDQFISYSRSVGTAYQIVLSQSSDDAFDFSLGVAPSISASFETVATLHYTRREPGTPPAAQDQLDAAAPLDPPAEVEQFAFWIGEWDVTSRIKPDDEWQESPARSRVDWALGGLALEDSWEGDLFDGPTMIWGLTRFNPEAGLWDRAWADSGDTGFAQYSGECAADGSCLLAGDSFFDITGNSFRWAHDHGDAGRIWEMDYTRQPE